MQVASVGSSVNRGTAGKYHDSSHHRASFDRTIEILWICSSRYPPTIHDGNPASVYIYQYIQPSAARDDMNRMTQMPLAQLRTLVGTRVADDVDVMGMAAALCHG